MEFLSHFAQQGKKQDTAVILLHGYGASQEDLFPLKDFFSIKADWYFPNAPLALGAPFFSGRAWFPIDMQSLEKLMSRGEYREFAQQEPKEMALHLNQLKEWIGQNFQDYQRLIIGGFSQGAMMSSHLIPMLWHQIPISAGLFFSSQLINEKSLKKSLADHTAIQTLKVFASHGQQDPILNPQGGKALVEVYQQWGVECQWHEFSGAHEISHCTLKAANEFLA